MARKGLVATPTTLMGLLRSFAYGWRQDALAANAAEISELGKQLYERLKTMGKHFDDGDARWRARRAPSTTRSARWVSRCSRRRAASGTSAPPPATTSRRGAGGPAAARAVGAGVPRQLDVPETSP